MLWSTNNISSLPRSVTPLLEALNRTHTPPPAPSDDFDLLRRLKEAARRDDVGDERMLWNDASPESSMYPPLVEKALKLFNLKQVAYEIETSVMSKVSCTACKAGAGLLQHYIKTGRSKEEIVKTIFQYCVYLKIQSRRVCEGVSQLFGVSSILIIRSRFNIPLILLLNFKRFFLNKLPSTNIYFSLLRHLRKNIIKEFVLRQC